MSRQWDENPCNSGYLKSGQAPPNLVNGHNCELYENPFYGVFECINVAELLI